MPMPGSQEMNSIDVAYFLNKWRWVIHGFVWSNDRCRTFQSDLETEMEMVVGYPIAIVATIIFMANFKMAV
jgi:hypothetical protein